ncbi:MAG: hypothetical protein ACC662_01720, partial [Planctomycetota bacterium]
LALTRLLEDKKSEVRKAAALSLTRRGDRRALGPILARMAGETDAQTLCTLLLAVGARGRGGDGGDLVGLANTEPKPTAMTVPLHQ